VRGSGLSTVNPCSRRVSPTNQTISQQLENTMRGIFLSAPSPAGARDHARNRFDLHGKAVA
jgi:hypothetical protein